MNKRDREREERSKSVMNKVGENEEEGIKESVSMWMNTPTAIQYLNHVW